MVYSKRETKRKKREKTARRKKKDFVIVETLKLPLRFVDPNQDWHTNDSFGNNFTRVFVSRMYFHLFFLRSESERVNERVCVCDSGRMRAKTCAKNCRTKRQKPYTQSEMNTPFIYIRASARFKTCFENFWLNLLRKNNNKLVRQ